MPAHPPENRLKLLLTNDDGINAPGLQRLLKRLRQSHDVVVYAPDSNCSGASHSITLRKPVHVNEIRPDEFAVSGTPADSVYMAISHGFRPDVVISGPNAGANMGCDTLYSGTVAAAMESRHIGVPAMALSLACEPGSHADLLEYETAADVALQLLAQLESWAGLDMTAFNVNVPSVATDELKGWRWTRLGQRGEPLPAVPWPGKDNAWQVGLAGRPVVAGADTDFHAVDSGYVSLTPLHQDFTAMHTLADAPELQPPGKSQGNPTSKPGGPASPQEAE